MKRLFVTVAGLFISFMSNAETPADRAPVTNAASLLAAAVDSPDGTGKGVLVGKLIQEARSKYGPVEAINIDVTTVRKLSQEGCRLFNVRFHLIRPRAATPKTKDAVAEIEIGFCRDGTQPAEIVDRLPRNAPAVRREERQ